MWEVRNKFPGQNKKHGVAKGKHGHFWYYEIFDPIK
jgi:hypothetical protein